MQSESDEWIQKEDITARKLDDHGRAFVGGDYAGEEKKMALLSTDRPEDMEILEVTTQEIDAKGRVSFGQKYADQELYIAPFQSERRTDEPTKGASTDE